MPPLSTLALLPTLCLSAVARQERKADETGLGWRGTRLDLEVYVDPPESLVVLEGSLRLRLEGRSSFGPTLVLNAGTTILEFEQVQGPPRVQVSLNQVHPLYPSVRMALVRSVEPFATGDELELDFSARSVGAASQFALGSHGALASWVENWYPIPAPAPWVGLRQTNAIGGTTRFHLPAGWSAVSNGRWLERSEEQGEVLQVFEVDPPTARSFAAGPFSLERRSVGEREITVALLPGSRGEAQRQAEALSAVLGALEARFGPYPYPSYAIVEVPEELGGFYASSEQGFIMVKPDSLGWPDGNLALFGHELAHGWFGNLVGNSGPGGELCSEGLCQLASCLAIEAIEGDEAATGFLRFSRPGYSASQCARGFFENARGGNDRPLSADQSKDSGLAVVRSKGHWVLCMLRWRIGDEVFFGVLRGLIREKAGSGLSVAELREAFQKAAPEAGLEGFFAQWLDRAGAPHLELEWEPVGEGSVAVTLRQIQGEKPYALVVELDVETSAGSQTHVVPLDTSEKLVELPASGEVSAVLLDPRHRILRWTPEYGGQ